MKRIGVLFLGLMVFVFVYAITYSLENITNSNITINGTNYDCSNETEAPDLPQDIGDISAITLDANCKVNESTRASLSPLMKTTDVSAVYILYSFDKSNWTQTSLIGASQAIVGPTGRSRTYSKSNINIDQSGLTNGAACTLYVYFKATENATIKTDPVSDPTVNPYEVYFTKLSDISFTDGSSFTPSITPGNNNELIGRFQLEADVTGATFTDASIDLSGTRSGFSNFKLWASADASYDAGDTQLGSTIGTDPQANPAVFSSFSLSIPTSATYILLTADVAESASGSIQGVIGEATDLTVTDGEVNGTITNAYMSNGGADVPTSIELASFTADVVQGKVNLQWSTASETENDHFLIIRDGEVIASVPGHGTCTEPHDYAYTDALVEPGVHEYVLADVTWGGEVTEHAPVNVEVESGGVSVEEFVLNKAYPNPFNPTVVLSMEYGVGSNAVLNIYNTQGVLVDQLINGFVEAGSYDITWDATNMPSGVYIVKMLAGNVMQSQKIVLMK